MRILATILCALSLGAPVSAWELPTVALSVEDLASICDGADRPAVIRMLDAEDGREASWMIFSIAADLPTVWQVVTNIRKAHLEDPAFPESSGRRTFMPFVQYGHTCNDGESVRLFQYLNLPLVADRKYTVVRRHAIDALPWEVRWDADPQMSCRGEPPPELADAIEDAVPVTINRGLWRLYPRATYCGPDQADPDHTIAIYYVDTNPGGIVGSLGFIATLAQRRALPQVVENVRFHAARWPQYLSDHGDPGDVEALRRLERHYRQGWSGDAADARDR
jgi:hypothetical protein